jgi:hypothetical protein
MAEIRANPPESKRITPGQQIKAKRARLDPGPLYREEDLG